MARLPLERILDANGDPVSGARAYIFDAGTTDAVTSYTDTALNTAHGAFVLANSAGEWPDAYVAPGIYKIRYTDADVTTLYEQDFVYATEGDGIAFASRSSAEAGGTASATYIRVGALDYVYDASGTALTTGDGRTWSPALNATPEHWGAAGDGTTDDRAEIVAADTWASASGRWLEIEATYGVAESLDLSSRFIRGKGQFKAVSGFTFTSDYVVRVGMDTAASESYDITIDVDMNNAHGANAGTWDASAGTFPAGASQDDAYLVNTAGTVAFVDFERYDLLVATAISPSTTAYTDNWEKRARKAAVQFNDAASAHGNLRVRASNADIGLYILENSERILCDVSGYFCATALKVERVASGGSPDNVTCHIRGVTCGQWAHVMGSCVTKLSMDTQGTDGTYEIYGVDIESDRTNVISGVMRADQFGAVRVDVGPAADKTTHVIFDDLAVMSQRNGTHAVEIYNSEAISGSLHLDRCNGGIYVRDTDGGHLSVTVYDQVAGTVATFGGDGGIATRLQFNLCIADNDGATAAIVSTHLARSDVRYTGIPLPCTHSAGVETTYRVPGGMITSDIAWTVVAAPDPVIVFEGSVTEADILAYSTPSLGMRCEQEDSNQLPVYYTGSGSTGGWQRPSVSDL